LNLHSSGSKPSNSSTTGLLPASTTVNVDSTPNSGHHVLLLSHQLEENYGSGGSGASAIASSPVQPITKKKPTLRPPIPSNTVMTLQTRPQSSVANGDRQDTVSAHFCGAVSGESQ
uniref:Polycomb protein Asx n=1 Tax=Anisakis simplex TaxID=6269 RepID=A0A0M3JPU5_ANISI